MNASIVEVMKEEYERRYQEEEKKMRTQLTLEEGLRQRDEMLLAVGREAATLLAIMIREAKCQRILEIGTSYGYSTLWLTEAAKAVGGRVVTLELDARKSAYAKQQMQRAGLADHVEFHVGDALTLLPGLSGSFDFVLIDLWKELYIPAFDLVYPKLAEGATVVGDNMLFPPNWRPETMRYRQHVKQAAGMTSVLLNVGQGMEVSRYKSE